MRYTGLGQSPQTHAVTKNTNWFESVVAEMHKKGEREIVLPFSFFNGNADLGKEDVGCVVSFDMKARTVKVVRTIGRDDFVKTLEDERVKFLENESKNIGGYKVTLSEDGRLFYLPDVCDMHGFWMSTQAVEGEPGEEITKDRAFDGVAMFKGSGPLEGKVWWRRIFPFAFYEIRSQRDANVVWPDNDDRVIDYLVINAHRNKN